MAALRFYPSTAIVVPRKNCSRILTRSSMDSCSRSESKQASSSSSFTCKVNNVYEEKSMGILCYTDEKGELVCEGLDEGPRLTWQDMQNLTKERRLKKTEDWRERTLQIAGGIDWSNLQTAASIVKK
ncbi:uncharacterized protein LOC124647283 [Lolium rigidum]|uniref:uncharacterized protein LOC124647283 n=1 Tax=Lolium rigidum TaxID=89674 RepID=UPI001F5CE8C7|nr:uncharacterized protein LOC124647283 [Lolium rigidum]